MANLCNTTVGVVYRWQGISLHCWLTALEMLMHWRHQSIYGADPATGNPRAAHTQTAQGLRAAGRGAAMTVLANDYGLAAAPPQLCNHPDVMQNWVDALNDRGPVIMEGIIGAPTKALRAVTGGRVGAHTVLVVGWSNSGTLAYYDPFFIGWKGAAGNHLSYMTLQEAHAATDRHSQLNGTCFWQAA